MGTGRQYDEEFKKQAIKLCKEVGKEERLKFIALKTNDGRITGKTVFIAEHLMLQGKHSTIVLREKASHGNTNHLWKK